MYFTKLEKFWCGGYVCYINITAYGVGGCYNMTRNDFMKDIEKNEIEITIKIDRIMPLKDAKDLVERELITKVMDNVKSTYKAAEILQVSQATIARKSKRYSDEMFR